MTPPNKAQGTGGELAALNGLFVGQLSAEELELFNAACREGTAKREYSDVAGFLGLARVKVVP